jgi:KipI family sensor histidine kinase inhibitor
MRLLPVGDAAVLVEFDEPAAVLPFTIALQHLPPLGMLDVVPAERTVLVRFDPGLTRPAAIVRCLREAKPEPGGWLEGPLVQLDVHYDGEDLAEVARLTGLTEAAVILAHTEHEWVVAFTGFAPGFGYLRCDHASQPFADVPRRGEPRVRVPAGAVAVAAGYTGVYPRASPGGWQLIGRTEAPVWDVDRDPPALLRPGVRVRFRDVNGVAG